MSIEEKTTPVTPPVKGIPYCEDYPEKYSVSWQHVNAANHGDDCMISLAIQYKKGINIRSKKICYY